MISDLRNMGQAIGSRKDFNKSAEINNGFNRSEIDYSQYIPSDERIVTIENAAELQLRQEHVVTLESRPPNIEGRGEVTIQNLVVNSPAAVDGPLLSSDVPSRRAVTGPC